MAYMRFPPKAVTVCSKEEEGFDFKNNHGCSKLANFCLDNINKIICKMLVILSYIALRLGLRKVQLDRGVFKLSTLLLSNW